MTSHPTSIGRYKILRPLGSGAMGDVYLAEDPNIGRQLAIKTVRMMGGAGEVQERQRRLLREARAAGKLLHPNVVTLFDADEADGLLYLAFEYVEGTDLSHRLARPPQLSLRQTVGMIREVAGALDCAHRQHIVHRDIKPSNILIATDGRAKVADFGIAKLRNQSTELTRTGSVVGSPQYMSPEQIRGEELDGRSDVFSLGVVLFEILTRVRPFEGETLSTLVFQILSQEPPAIEALRPGLPPRIVALVRSMMAKDRDLRLASGQAVIGEVDAVLAEVPAAELDGPAVPSADNMPTQYMPQTRPSQPGAPHPGAPAAASTPGPVPPPPPAVPPPPPPAPGSPTHPPTMVTPPPMAGRGIGTDSLGTYAEPGRRSAGLWIAVALIVVLGVLSVTAWFLSGLLRPDRRPRSASSSTPAPAAAGAGYPSATVPPAAASAGEPGTVVGTVAATEAGTGAATDQPGAKDPEPALPATPATPQPGSTPPPATPAPMPETSAREPAAAPPPTRVAPPVAPPPSRVSVSPTAPPRSAAEPPVAPPPVAPPPAAPPEPGVSRRFARGAAQARSTVETGLFLQFEVEPDDAIVAWEASDGTRIVQGAAKTFEPKKRRNKSQSVQLPESGEYLIRLTRDGYPEYVVLVRADASRGSTPYVVRARLGGR